MTRSPPRDDAATITFPVCGQPFTPAGRRQYCGDRCRQTAFRRRHQDQPRQVTVPPARSSHEHTVHEYPDCKHRLSGEQRRPDCGIFTRRTGPGGPRPHSCEPAAIADLTREVASMTASR